jgi:type II secretory pathway component GspD/PulD (secretin)
VASSRAGSDCSSIRSPFFESISDVDRRPRAAWTSPSITRLFRYFESIGVGETVASPSVTVQSGEQGRIQSGTDIPVTLQDFAGNTITQYIATGIIIDVRPTLVADASDAPGGEPVEFIHLDVAVEKSSGRPSAAGITIDKNQTKTQVLLLNGEQTVIGGLFSTEESVFRKGIPVLKDIPLIRYLFSYEQKTTVQKELLIVLQARVVEPLRARAGQPYPTNLYERERQDVRQRLDRFKPGAGDDLRLINPDNPERAYRAPANPQP